MPYNKFTYRPTYLDSGALKCPCIQTFKFESGRNVDTKVGMHKEFCDELPGQLKGASRPRKAMTQEEYTRTIAKRREFL